MNDRDQAHNEKVEEYINQSTKIKDWCLEFKEKIEKTDVSDVIQLKTVFEELLKKITEEETRMEEIVHRLGFPDVLIELKKKTGIVRDSCSLDLNSINSNECGEIVGTITNTLSVTSDLFTELSKELEKTKKEEPPLKRRPNTANETELERDERELKQFIFAFEQFIKQHGHIVTTLASSKIAFGNVDTYSEMTKELERFKKSLTNFSNYAEESMKIDDISAVIDSLKEQIKNSAVLLGNDSPLPDKEKTTQTITELSNKMLEVANAMRVNLYVQVAKEEIEKRGDEAVKELKEMMANPKLPREAYTRIEALLMAYDEKRKQEEQVEETEKSKSEEQPGTYYEGVLHEGTNDYTTRLNARIELLTTRKETGKLKTREAIELEALHKQKLKFQTYKQGIGAGSLGIMDEGREMNINRKTEKLDMLSEKLKMEKENGATYLGGFMRFVSNKKQKSLQKRIDKLNLKIGKQKNIQRTSAMRKFNHERRKIVAGSYVSAVLSPTLGQLKGMKKELVNIQANQVPVMAAGRAI